MFKYFLGAVLAQLPITGAAVVVTPHSNTTQTQVLQTKNVKTFDGHFPGMGPYGFAGDQDHAWGKDSGEDTDVKFDISTTSVGYINDHYIDGKGDSPAYAIYDFETDAYPHGDFTEAFAEINDYAPDGISKIMTLLVNYIGIRNGKLFAYRGGYEAITMHRTWYGSYYFHWAVDKNQPFD